MKWPMLIEDVLEMQSRDAEHYMAEGFDIHGTTVADAIEHKTLETNGGYYHDIREEMRKAGVNLVPVLISADYFLEGHHRVMIAMELGHEEIMVTDDEWEFDQDSYEIVHYQERAVKI